MEKTFADFVDIPKLEEGVNDPAIFKAVFLAGGPGSGKSFMVGQTGLTALGFKIVNSDQQFEIALKQAGMTQSPADIFSTKGQSLRDRAKFLTAKKQDGYLAGRLGLVIDGTGREYDKISKQKKLIIKNSLANYVKIRLIHKCQTSNFTSKVFMAKQHWKISIYH